MYIPRSDQIRAVNNFQFGCVESQVARGHPVVASNMQLFAQVWRSGVLVVNKSRYSVTKKGSFGRKQGLLPVCADTVSQKHGQDQAAAGSPLLQRGRASQGEGQLQP